MPTVNMLEAKTQLSKLVEAVESGAETEVIIARNGKPAARLVPLAEKPPIRLGLHDGEYPPLTDEMIAEWNKENEAMWAEALSGPLFPEEPVRDIKRRKRA